MARAVIKTTQIIGVNGGTLFDDISTMIQDMLKTYNTPVETKNDLPNNDTIGSIRLVENEGKYYLFKNINGHNVWEAIKDLVSQSRESVIGLIDGQTVINTALNVGGIDGIINLDTVKISINGQDQYKGRDYTLQVDTEDKMVITWISNDFDLEATDEFVVAYDILTQ